MRVRIGACLAAASLAALVGCDLAPTYDPPALLTPIPAAYKSGGHWQQATPSDTLPRGPWWEAYGDPLLNRLEGDLIAANPDLASAVAHYDAARAYVAEVNSGLFPFISVGGMNTTNQQSQQAPRRRPGLYPNQFGDNILDMQVGYEVDLWDRVHNQIAAAQAQTQATAADLENVRLSLEAELANDYTLLRGFDAQIKLLADTSFAYAGNFKLVQTRYAGKIASGIDMAQAKLDLDSARSLEAQIFAQRALVEHAIATLVGQPASSFTIARVDALTLVLPNTPTGVPATLLQRRPDIAAAERRVAAANRIVGVARAAFFPSLTLGAIGGFENSLGAQLFSLPLSFWTVGPGYVLPLFEGGLRHAALAQSYADLRDFTEQYRATVLRAFEDVEDQLALLNNLSLATAAEREAADDATRYYDLSYKAFLEGQINYLDVEIAETAALNARRQVIAIQTQVLQANVRLVRSLGGGWSTKDLPTPDAVTDYTPTKS